MNRIGRASVLGLLLPAAAAAFAGCGGDDEKSSRGGSFDSIASAIESPTGTVDEDTAPNVGEEYGKMSQANGLPGGRRRDAQTAQAGSGTQSCPEGGSFTVTASGNQSSGSATASYDNCCFIEDCCFDGNATSYYSQGSSDYQLCTSYDLSYQCEGTSASASFEGCFTATGEQVYVVEVDGDTYSVSGNYSNGSGSLEIRGENGSWSCTYSSGSGSCTSSTGDSFTF